MSERASPFKWRWTQVCLLRRCRADLEQKAQADRDAAIVAGK